MTLKFSSTRPDDELDGMQPLEAHFLSGDPEDVLAVAVISRNGLTKKDPAPFAASIKIKHIEHATGEDAATVRDILKRLYVKRTGNEPLPIEEPELDIEGGDEE